MSVSINFTKLVVRDVAVAERFYLAVGLKVVSCNVGGEAEVVQEECWVSATGDLTSHTIILSRFLELPPPPRPIFPGEA
jgi:hypothetical protein